MQPGDGTYPFPRFSGPLRLTLAAAMMAAVVLLDFSTGSAFDQGSHFLVLGTVVMGIAWLAGTGAALGATVVASVLAAVRMEKGSGHLHLALFLMNALLLIAVVAELRRAQRAADLRAREAFAARQQGEAASRMKDEFLATISHELRTPLNAVLGWVYLLRTARLDHETTFRGLQAIERNVRLQARLTSDLLDVSKALSGKLQLDPRRTSLDEAVRQAASAMKPAAKAKDLALAVTVPPGRVIVDGDPTRLRQIAWQLINNAIKFSARGGSVEVAVDAFGQDARLIVRDNGPGIAADFLPRVFERFTQADPSSTRTAGGLGVGLALVRELVELHGGEVEVRNREDRSGAIFMARFPLQALEEAPQEPSLAHGVGNDGHGALLEGLRVLVLEPEAETRDLLRAVLQQGGAAVETTASVAEALHCLETWHPDVLVSDAPSPEHDSYAVIGKVQSLDADRGGRIPAVALTSVARTDERLRGMLADVQSEVPKPFEPAALTSEIARLSGRERRRERR
jgi:signal transduction histidine kinase/CheY-like chemotaxis protein